MANYVRGELTVFPRAVSVTSVDVEYARAASNTTAPSSGWQTTVPPPTAGEPYIWSRTKTVQSNSAVPLYSAPMCITSESGEGIHVTDITEEYYLSTSSSEPTGGEWTEAPPEWENGNYIWTRSVLVYSDSTVSDPHIVTTDPVLATYLNLSESTRANLDNVQNTVNSSVNRLNNIEAKIQIGESEIGFYDENGIKVAWINGNEFHFTQGFVEHSLQIGHYLLKDDGDGGFAIV